MKKLRKLLGQNSGIAAVEFALVLPLLLLFLFGIIEMGLAWHTKQVVTNVCREGARYGTLYTATPSADPNGDVVTYVNQLLTNLGFPAAQIVSVTCTGAEGATGDPVTVSVSANHYFPVLSPIAGLQSAITINGTAVMRHE
ncbi:TadE/TadG family type IV pilus assembly protein [Desulfoferula mesophila]|uniref:TadE-like domain-containing protein n=1 Tax=Desulfoferula mesophila TaxID=3058419 RepID=A0AAU9E950_9BACT|nr:hypothetical protein FAK_07340 [Desulfoferula mesophilus]